MMYQSENNMTERIFDAVDRLIAKEGIRNLSMHKLSKEAEISAGTIYLYFKNKEELLDRFAEKIFLQIRHAVEKDFDEKESFFEQYQRMWRNIWNLMQQNPALLSNMYQYESLPTFMNYYQKFDEGHWAMFCKKAQLAKVVCDLPHSILFSLGLETAINVAYQVLVLGNKVNDHMLQQVIERSWRSIQQ